MVINSRLHTRKYLPFRKAKSFVQKLGLKSYQEWFDYCRSGKKPENIPVYPMREYKKLWLGMGNWLGTGRIANQNRVYRNFEDARRFVQSLGIKTVSLMGRNWPDYVPEAKRCLATNGYLLIADTTKSIKGSLSKLPEIVKKQGFEIYSDEEKVDFTFIEARVL